MRCTASSAPTHEHRRLNDAKAHEGLSEEALDQSLQENDAQGSAQVEVKAGLLTNGDFLGYSQHCGQQGADDHDACHARV